MSKLIKAIAIVSSVTFAGMVVVGTAAASGASFPQKLERLSQIMSDRAQDVGERARSMYGEGLGTFAKLFRAEGGQEGEDPGKGHGAKPGQTPQGSGSGGAIVPRQPMAPSRGGNGGGDGGIFSSQLPNLRSPAGSLIPGQSSGAGGSGGSSSSLDNTRRTALNNEKENSGGGDKPAPTPIPGAAWLLGSGLAGIAALSRFRRQGAQAGQPRTKSE